MLLLGLDGTFCGFRAWYFETLIEIGFRDNAWFLARDVIKILINAGLNESFDTFVGLKGVFIAAFNQPEPQKE
jgi:hypothetical protein